MPPSTAVVLMLAPWYVELLQCLGNCLASMCIMLWHRALLLVCRWSGTATFHQSLNDLYQPRTHVQSTATARHVRSVYKHMCSRSVQAWVRPKLACFGSIVLCDSSGKLLRC